MAVTGAYKYLDTPTVMITVVSVLTNAFTFTWCTNCVEGPFIAADAAFGAATQLTGIGLSVTFQSGAGAWQTHSENEIWSFSIPGECTCNEGYFPDELGNDCGSKCFRGYEAGHLRAPISTVQDVMYSGICICDADYSGPSCTETCSTTQPHQHCLIGDHRAELVAVLSNTQAVCRAPPQQIPMQIAQAVEISLTKSADALGNQHPEYTSSSITVQII
jgi:hypothetical protein